MQPSSPSNTGDHVPASLQISTGQQFIVKPLDWRLVVSHAGTAYKAQTPFGCYIIEWHHCHEPHWVWFSQFGGHNSTPISAGVHDSPDIGLGAAMDDVFKHWLTCLMYVLEPTSQPLPPHLYEPSVN